MLQLLQNSILNCSFPSLAQAGVSLLLLLPLIFPVYISTFRTNNLTTSLQSQIQMVRDNMNKITDERNTLKKILDSKNQDLLEKARTITQVKKIGRRYKTQYDELKVEHDRVRAPL